MRNEEHILVQAPEWHRCTWYKVEAEASNSVVWKSRTLHYSFTPSDIDGLCIYTYHMPRGGVAQEGLLRKEAFEKWLAGCNSDAQAIEEASAEEGV